ncbi:SCP-like protein [Ancylostoma ceylanicum]|uniref:SCP-like protein n=1 Tax=Ancylostoma ceylanicum TaxID=53326 RepID=A0A0D6LVW6_9BILA|nr:SCP-like protein [Ancylostoma ceylanicum]
MIKIRLIPLVRLILLIRSEMDNLSIVFIPGAPLCGTGGVESSETTGIVKLINNRRTALVDGTQRNGNSGGKLPAAKLMNAITWSCALEQAAKDNVKNYSCDENFPPGDPQGRAEFYQPDYEEQGKTIEQFISEEIDDIDTYALQDVGSASVKYKDDPYTRAYANLIRATTTQIGCTKKICTDIQQYILYCITNQKSLVNGDIIYEVGVAEQCICPTGTICDPTSKLCVISITTVPSVTEWWKVIRSVNYFANTVVFRPFHDGERISSFTQVSDGMGYKQQNRMFNRQVHEVKPIRRRMSILTKTWSCELEKATQDGLSSHSCADGFAPLDPQGRAQFYNYDSIDSATTVEEYIRGRLAEIDHTALKDVSQSSVKFQDDILTNEYSYVVLFHRYKTEMPFTPEHSRTVKSYMRLAPQDNALIVLLELPVIPPASYALSVIVAQLRELSPLHRPPREQPRYQPLQKQVSLQVPLIQ